MNNNLQSEAASNESETEEQRLEREEYEALQRIVHAFTSYWRHAELEVSRWETMYGLLSANHKALLPQQPEKFVQARQAIYNNHFFLQSMLAAFDPANAGAPAHLQFANNEQEAEKPVSPVDVDKVRYVLKNLVRDWAAEGADERQQSYGRILNELKRVFANRSSTDAPPRVLVPGAGLARLCCEIAGLGYEAQGNEFSYYMLLMSSFILNHTFHADQHTIFPYLHSNCNQLSTSDQLRPVSLPDVAPTDLVAGPGLLSMCAGDFVEVYTAPDMKEKFDCVVTCFFIDTAHNVIQYLEVIHYCLKPNGAWINLGPLLYHWADDPPLGGNLELSIELPLDDIRRIALSMGFRLDQEQTVDAAYIANIKAMYKTVYQACFWTMIKEPAST